MMNYTMVLIGVLIYALFDLNKAIPKEGFKWSVYIQKNLIVYALNLVIGLTLVYTAITPELIDSLPFNEKLLSVLLGYGGQTVWKQLIHCVSSKTKTLIGRN